MLLWSQHDRIAVLPGVNPRTQPATTFTTQHASSMNADNANLTVAGEQRCSGASGCIS